MFIRKISLSIVFLVFAVGEITAQQYLDPAYVKVTNERAAKIVEKLELSNVDNEKAVTNIIAQQYRDLSKIQDARDAEIKTIKENKLLSKEKQNVNIDEIKERANKSISSLHKSYIKKLSSKISEEKITEVKDGMTYGVVPITYGGYLDMLRNLTESQKKMIYDNLVEAREHAMDAGSSKEKHGWFGKYKGRINNVLSAEGYDLNKESADWHERTEERKKGKS
jgi:hypothetical protein